MMVLCECLTCFHVVMMIIMLWPWSGYLWQSPPAMCAVHHHGLHPASLWAALISQKQPEIFSLTKLLRPHLDYKPPFPSDKIDHSGLWLFYPRTQFHSYLFPITKYDSQPAIDKKPSYSPPPSHWEACPPGPGAALSTRQFHRKFHPGLEMINCV